MTDHTQLSWTLRPTTPADIAAVRAIESAPHAWPFVGQFTPEEHQAVIDNPDRLHFVVVEHDAIDDPDAPIHGYAIIAGLANVDNNIEIMRLALARSGTGMGMWFVNELVEQAFAIPGAHRVWLDVVAKNVGADALYRKVGFVQEGTMREAYRDDTGRSDLYLMSLLRHEWDAGSNDPL